MTDKIKMITYNYDYFIVDDNEILKSHMSCFNYRPNLPIKTAGVGFYKTDFDHIDTHIKSCVQLTNKQFLSNESDICVQQLFLNIACYIPTITIFGCEFNKFTSFNSLSLNSIYEEIIDKHDFDTEPCQLVYTKTYNIDNKLNPNIDENRLYYLIPHLNVYKNMHIFDEKTICELTGTII